MSSKTSLPDSHKSDRTTFITINICSRSTPDIFLSTFFGPDTFPYKIAYHFFQFFFSRSFSVSKFWTSSSTLRTSRSPATPTHMFSCNISLRLLFAILQSFNRGTKRYCSYLNVGSSSSSWWIFTSDPTLPNFMYFFCQRASFFLNWSGYQRSSFVLLRLRHILAHDVNHLFHCAHWIRKTSCSRSTSSSNCN